MATKLQVLLASAIGYNDGYFGSAETTSPQGKKLLCDQIYCLQCGKARLFDKVRAQVGVQITGIQGSHSDKAAVVSLASKSCVVITSADVNDINATNPVLKGLRRGTKTHCSCLEQIRFCSTQIAAAGVGIEHVATVMPQRSDQHSLSRHHVLMMTRDAECCDASPGLSTISILLLLRRTSL
jgi:hypothetical protein